MRLVGFERKMPPELSANATGRRAAGARQGEGGSRRLSLALQRCVSCEQDCADRVPFATHGMWENAMLCS